uniref:Uncharacterized LOC114647944 n=1 Tax=Erpetoichthys calabaricus TaxID=27687 RepID=A0A8C4RP86_ERPCA
MNTHTSAHTLLRAKAGKLWIPVLLFFPLAFAYVPDTCRNSMKQEHLSILDRLVANQLVNSCNIRYKFIEESQLSKTCFVKAVFPKILDLLNDHFKYGKNSSNGKDVQLLKDLIGNIYKIRCIPPIDLDKEDNPEKFWKDFDEPPQAALRRIRSAAAIYLNLLATYRKGPNWECSEYDAEVQAFTTGSVSSTKYESSSLANHKAERGLREGSKEEQTSFKMACVGLAVLSCLLLIVIAYLLVKKGKKKDPRGQLYKEVPLTSCAYDTEMQPCSPLNGADHSEVLRKTSE